MPAAWAAIDDPAERTETALLELYAFYAHTRGMYESLFRDEELVPAVRRRMRDIHEYLRRAQDALMAHRGLRGRAASRTRAAIGHAVAFSTWRSLTQDQRLHEADAVALMCRLVSEAAYLREPPSQTGERATLPPPPS